MTIPSNLSVGQHFIHGTWKGDPIEWRVLYVKDSWAMAISVCVLDNCWFNMLEGSGNDYGTSDLRNWLEHSFFPMAFSLREQENIQIGCLDENAALSLFSSDNDRIGRPTAHVKSRGVYVNESTGGCCWWLRSPGRWYSEAIAVDTYGQCVYQPVGSINIGIRPAIGISLKPASF